MAASEDIIITVVTFDNQVNQNGLLLMFYVIQWMDVL